MNLPEILQQFKTISPDPAYSEQSKRAILATMPRERARAGLGIIIGRIFETGIAVALVVFFIITITSSFSNAPYAAPVQFSVINPETLKAEAQAVNIEIQLADVAYTQPTSTASIGETTPAIAATGTNQAPAGFAPAALRIAGVKTPATSTPDVATGTTPVPTVSVDQALNALSK